MIVIDYEYCSYNHRAFDIANHFSEWCFEYDTKEFPHFKFDKSRFPSTSTQRRFAGHYLQQLSHLEACKGGDKVATSSSDGVGQQVVQTLDVDALVDEVQPFLMASNLMWALWCIRSAKSSGIKFGYWVSASASASACAKLVHYLLLLLTNCTLP